MASLQPLPPSGMSDLHAGQQAYQLCRLFGMPGCLSPCPYFISGR
jgi:hypothetical protein